MPIELNIPGSKSATNRALIISSLLNRNIILKDIAICDDTSFMIAGLKQLGKTIEQENGTLDVKAGWKQSSEEEKIKIYTGNAGTTTRFLTAVSALLKKRVRIRGDERMKERPIAPLIDALNKLGANIKSQTGCPPLEIERQALQGGEISLPGNISSQYISAILMVAPFIPRQTIIKIEQKLCSKPYVNMTIEMLRHFGIKITNKNFAQFTIEPHSKSTDTVSEYQIEGDASSASYIGAFAALNPAKPVLLKNIHRSSLQGDIKFIEYLIQMDCKVVTSEKGTQITGPKKLISLGTVDMNTTPDLVMTFAVLAMFTEGKTRLENISNLRIKETDRLTALENEMKKFGITATTGIDFIEIEGNPNIRMDEKTLNKKIELKTYDDHRIAMCFGITKHTFPLLKIEDPDCVSKSYPTFWQDLEKVEQFL